MDSSFLVARAFSAGETVALELPVRARWTWADPRVDTARVLVDGDPIERDGQVLVHLRTQEFEDRAWPYGPGQPELGDGQRLVPLTPYHGRANLGPATMRVWMPTTVVGARGSG